MSKAAFDKIAEGFEEALAIARGEAAPRSGDIAMDAIGPFKTYDKALVALVIGEYGDDMQIEPRRRAVQTQSEPPYRNDWWIVGKAGDVGA